MAKRAVRRRRRQEEAAKNNTGNTTPASCAGDGCSDTSTTTVNIDGNRYQVCDLHAELVMIQEGRRSQYLREQKRRQTEEALGLRH